MKKLILAMTIVSLFVITMQSKPMTIGFYYQIGKTLTDEWKIAQEDMDSIREWDPKSEGYFIQLLYEMSEFQIGLEYSHVKFYSIRGYGESNYFSQPYPIHEDLNPDRLLTILQYSLYKNLYVQIGAGIQLKETRFSSMISIRHHFKINNFLRIPLFIRGDIVSKKGTPTVLSIGTGIVIHWKSGL